MDRIDYLRNWHHESQSFIGLISLAKDMDKVKSILEEYKPRFKALEKARYKALTRELNMSDEETQHMWAIVGYKEEQ